MIQVSIIGTGALARNLYNAFSKQKEIQLQIIGRSKEQFVFFSKAKTSDDFSLAQQSDVILIAVSDTAVNECEQRIGLCDTPIAHCAGSLSLKTLKSPNAAVFYPLQTFNNSTFVDFEQVPILIESKNPKTLLVIRSVAELISKNVSELNSAKRKEAHLAAVFANNFSNFLFGISKELLEEFDLPAYLLDQLILQTAKNAVTYNPKHIQSGPAKRNDLKAIKGHLEMIYNPNHKELYQQLSKAIKDNYHEL